MMVADIEERMTADEFLGWAAYSRGHRTLPRDAGGIMAELSKLGIERK